MHEATAVAILHNIPRDEKIAAKIHFVYHLKFFLNALQHLGRFVGIALFKTFISKFAQKLQVRCSASGEMFFVFYCSKIEIKTATVQYLLGVINYF